MVTGTERKALETVSPQTGQTTPHRIGKRMGIDPGYAQVLCRGLVKSQYLVAAGKGVLREIKYREEGKISCH